MIAQVPEQAVAVMARLGLAECEELRGDVGAALASAEAAKSHAIRLQGGKPASFRTGLASLMKARTLAAAGRAGEAVDPGHSGVAEAARLSAKE